MRRFRLLLSFVLNGLTCVPGASAAVPALLNHQGRIAVNGVNFDGNGQFKFALVNAGGTTTYWSNDGTSTVGSEPTAFVTLTVTKGLYSVLLGDTELANMSVLPETVFATADVRLRVWFNDGVNGSELISPDHRLAAAPYALVASTVDEVLLSAVVAPPVKPVVAWGNNTNSQTAVPTLTDVVAIAAGSTQSLALFANGTVTSWGAGAAVPGGLTGVTHLAAGALHNLARKSDGTVVAWGNNTYAQATVPGGISNAIGVAAGENHSLILRADGSVTAFGDNSFNQTTVPGTAVNVTAIAAGYDHNLALKADGTVVAWGRDNVGQVSGTAPSLGTIVSVIDGTSFRLSQPLPAATLNLIYDGTTTLSSTCDGSDVVTVADTSALYAGMTVAGPGIVGPAGLTNVVAIAAGAYHSLAVKSDGTVVAWGWDNAQQCTVPSSLNGVSGITAGYGFSLALKTDGTIVAWGEGADGQTTVPSTATQVTQIAAGGAHALALRAALIPAQVARLDQDNVFTGKLGIKRVPAVHALEVEGEASKSTAGNWLANSDRRIKREIQPVTGALEKLDRVRLVDFRYTEEYCAAHPEIQDKRYLNVIAQEFAKVFPDHVQSSREKLPNGADILQVDTYPLTIYSAAAVQELHRQWRTENDALKRQLAEQEERLKRLEAATKP